MLNLSFLGTKVYFRVGCRWEFAVMNSSSEKIQKVKLNSLNSAWRAESFFKKWLLIPVKIYHTILLS